MKTPPDGRLVAQKNETAVLRALHRYGWLRTRDLAVLVWHSFTRLLLGRHPSLAPLAATDTAIRMAQRTLARMRRQRLVLSTNAPNGSRIHALSERGARVLQGLGVPATTGKDLVRDYHAAFFLHRCIANEVAISATMAGYRVSTEREIAQGRWLGGGNGIAGKKPDVLVRSGAMAWWVEVEHSHKNRNDYAKLLRWLVAIWQNTPRPGEAAPLHEDVTLRQVVFICTKAFAKKLTADLQEQGWSAEQVASRLRYEASLYSFEAIAFF
ncbi:hypothetical protein [Pseudogulbenkiania subflava]|uniref:Replication-relaxation n=1 Tax=Pseudogulbenkiania subflava DSM 22618 TaxID=1123014 RepID=A0A1Y6CGV5_9NEIS|nr:hypothetical protein [Pseudogulbenkiania subflava]SMF52433.1 hypothetical protein SAMN02745746_03766 [Pseudogulbenkiania subflava DSM 22618]